MRASLVFLAALIAVTYSAGQYYVPRSYYIIDSEGHETAPVPLRRLRRSLGPVYENGPYGRPSSNANANANAYADGGNANANANAYAGGRMLPQNGGNPVPLVYLGSSRPNTPQ